MPKIIFLWTDIALFALLLAVLGYAYYASRSPALRATWGRVARNTPAMCSAVVLLAFVVIGLLDSLHYQPRLPPVAGAPATNAPIYAPKVMSLLDALLEDTAFARPEKTYSAPLAWLQYTKESILQEGGEPRRDFPRLRFGGKHLTEPEAQWGADVTKRLLLGLLVGLLVACSVVVLTLSLVGRGRREALASEQDVESQQPHDPQHSAGPAPERARVAFAGKGISGGIERFLQTGGGQHNRRAR